MASESKHILFITQYFPPEIGAAAERMVSMARFMAERAQVTVLAPVPSYPWGSTRKYSYSQQHCEDENDLTIIRIYKFPHRKYFLLRLFGEIQYTISSLIKAWRFPDTDLVLISSPSFFLGFIGLILKRIKGIDFIFDVRDRYPDSVLDAGVLRNGFIYRLFKRLEIVFYRHAKIVSIVHGGWQPEIEALCREVVVVPNGIDRQRFRWQKELKLSQDRSDFLGKHFVVLFVGNLGMLYDFSPFLAAAKELWLKGNRDVQFIFLGEGQQKANLMHYPKAANIGNCHFWDPVPSELLPAILHQSNIGIVGVNPQAKSIRGCIPNKVYEYLISNLDIIACIQGNLPRALLESGKFFVFENSDVDGIVEKILEVKCSGEKSSTSSELLEKISRENLFEHLWSAIQDCC